MKTKENHWEKFRFEFALYINEHHPIGENGRKPFICQRFFDIRNFNEKVINSLEMKELTDSLTGIYTPTMGLIPKFLKQISKKQCWSEYNPYRVVELGNETKELFKNEDIFTFEIKVDKKVVAKSSFSGNWFQPEVRSEVDIREIIPDIIKEIEYFFTKKEYTLPC